MKDSMIKLWEKVDFDVKLTVGVILLYLLMYPFIDAVEWIAIMLMR